jgi:membrane-bound lytic murein transglycosylase D
MYTKKKNVRWIALTVGLVTGATLAAGARASGNWLVDSRLSPRDAAGMAETARRGTSFPIAMNDDVLRELNSVLATPKGKEFLARARVNLGRLRPMLDRELAGQRLPEELLAVAFRESGFASLPESAHPMQSAGMWQFIPSTARKFGLRVDEVADERLDEVRSTRAALRYLSELHDRFHDWQLAIMAYNMGERALENAIARAGTRDPWRLVALGYEGDAHYLARVMAGVLILRDARAHL